MDLLDQVVMDVLARDDNDLPEGARALIYSVWANRELRRYEPHKKYHFLADWKRNHD